MKTIYLGEVNLVWNKQVLETFLTHHYFHTYGRDRYRHQNTNDPRLPNLKITDDLFSLMLYYRDRAGSEHAMLLDGKIFLNTLTVHTISFQSDNSFLDCSDSEYAATFDLLKEFTSLAEDGWISLTVNGHPVRLVNGKEERYKELLTSLYQQIPPHLRDTNSELTSIYQTLSLLKTKNN